MLASFVGLAAPPFSPETVFSLVTFVSCLIVIRRVIDAAGKV